MPGEKRWPLLVEAAAVAVPAVALVPAALVPAAAAVSVEWVVVVAVAGIFVIVVRELSWCTLEREGVGLREASLSVRLSIRTVVLSQHC